MKINGDFKTIGGHLADCKCDLKEFKDLKESKDLEEFKKKYPYKKLPGDADNYIEDGFINIKVYNSKTGDKHLLSKEEFTVLVGYLSYNKLDIKNIKLLIETIKSLDIPYNFDILLKVVNCFDELYFSSPGAIAETKKIVDAIKIWGASKDTYLKTLEDHLSSKKMESEKYRIIQKKKIKDYLDNLEGFLGYDEYEKELYDLLEKYRYDADYILKHLPSTDLIEKDYLALQTMYIKPLSFILYERYLAGDKKMNGIRNNLGFYDRLGAGRIPVPYTKGEFLNGIHSIYDEKERRI